MKLKTKIVIGIVFLALIILFVFVAGAPLKSEYTMWRFTARVLNTNGTVGLDFNGMNLTAANITLWELFRPDNSIYAVWIELPPGTYYYYWWAYGNGTNHLYNVSSVMNITI